MVRTDLGLAEPGSAPGEQLGLWHYVIAAGELEYSVISGEGVLLRADGSSEAMGPGTYQLAAAGGVIENPDLEHHGANRGEGVVSVISATLFAAGQPVATVVEVAADQAE